MPTSGTSTAASSAVQNDGTFSKVMSSTRPPEQRADTCTSPAGASRTIRVSGSTIGTIPVSSSTAAVLIAFVPDIPS